MWVIEFDDRSDSGPALVGPFSDKATAALHATDLARVNGTGWFAQWNVAELVTPSISIRAGKSKYVCVEHQSVGYCLACSEQ